MTDRHDAHLDDYEQFKVEIRCQSRRRFRLLAGGLVAATLALNVAPVAANHLNVKASDINNGAVTTPKLRDGAVSNAKLANRSVDEAKVRDGAVSTRTLRNSAVGTAKLGDNAVTTPKIRNRAVGSLKLARGVPGVAPAGLEFSGDGTFIFNWFNRFGGQPTVTRTGVGSYDVAFPGLEGRLGIDATVVGTATGAGAVRIVTKASTGPNQDIVSVLVRDISGNPADSDVNLVVMALRPAVGAAAAESEARRDSDD